MLEKNNMNTFLGISVTAAILAGVLVVSCAPVPQSSSRITAPQTQAVSANEQTPQPTVDVSALDGDWVCGSEDGCAYNDISISTKDGAAVLNGNTEESAKLVLTTSKDAKNIQLTFNTKDAKLSGIVSLKNAKSELNIGDDSYLRSSPTKQ